MREAKESTAQGCTHIKKEIFREADGFRGDSAIQRQKEIFLDAYREIGTILRSYKAAGVCRRTIYNWQDDDEAFKRAFGDAKEDFADLLEERLYKRAETAGQNRPNIEGLAALKANRREKWGDSVLITPSEPVIIFKVVRVEVVESVTPAVEVIDVTPEPATNLLATPEAQSEEG